MEVSMDCAVLLVMVLIVFPGVTRKANGVPCSVPNIQKCISTLTNVTSQTRFLFPALSTSRYTAMCRNYKAAEKCIDAQKNCGTDAKKVMRNTVALLEFACYSQVDEYTQFKGEKCFSRVLIKAELELCTKTYVGVPESMIRREKTTPTEVDKFCKLTQDVLYCRYLVVEDHCGKQAAQWQHKAHIASYTLVFDMYNCDVDLDSNFKIERTSLAVVLGIFIVLLILFSLPLRVLFCPPPELIAICQTRTITKNDKRRQIALDIVGEGHMHTTAT